MSVCIVELPKTKPYRGCTEIVQRLCDYRADIIRSYDFCTMLFCSPVEKNKLYARCNDQTQGLRTMTLRSYDATYDVIYQGYDLTILENLYNSALNKIIEATETVNPYEIVRSSYATPGRSCD